MLVLISQLLSLSVSAAEQSRVLSADITTYTIDGLQPDDSVVVGVAPVTDKRTGEVVSVSTRTTGSTGIVTGLQVVEVTSTRILISWTPVNRATGYKITWRRSDGMVWTALNLVPLRWKWNYFIFPFTL